MRGLDASSGEGGIDAEEVDQDGDGQDRAARPDHPESHSHQEDREVSGQFTQGLFDLLSLEGGQWDSGAMLSWTPTVLER